MGINQAFLDEMAGFPLVLVGCLRRGKNGGRLLLAIGHESDRTRAENYVREFGCPTEAVPNPDIEIRVITDSEIQHGAMVDGRLVVRYSPA